MRSTHVLMLIISFDDDVDKESKRVAFGGMRSTFHYEPKMLIQPNGPLFYVIDDIEFILMNE